MNEASEEDFPPKSPQMDDDTLTLLSDTDHILLSDSDDIPQTGSMNTGQLGEDFSFSHIYGDLAELQPLPDTPLPVYNIDNNGYNGVILCGVFEKGEPSVRKRVKRHDKGSGKETKVAAGGRADKEKAAQKEDEDKGKRRRTAEQHSVYERKRRSRIQEKLRTLQEMVPNASKLTKSSMLDETIKHIKGLQLHLQMMTDHGVGFLSPYMQMGGMQNRQPTQYYSPYIPMSSLSEMEYAHGHGTLPSAGFCQPMSPAVGDWPQMSGTGVFPYYYPPRPMFPAADGSPVPPVVPAQVFVQVNPPNHPVPPMVPTLHQVNLANQGEATYQNGPIVPDVQEMLNLQQMRRTAQEFSLPINVPEQLGEASPSYGGNQVDYIYNLVRPDPPPN